MFIHIKESTNYLFKLLSEFFPYSSLNHGLPVQRVLVNLITKAGGTMYITNVTNCISQLGKSFAKFPGIYAYNNCVALAKLSRYVMD